MDRNYLDRRHSYDFLNLKNRRLNESMKTVQEKESTVALKESIR